MNTKYLIYAIIFVMAIGFTNAYDDIGFYKLKNDLFLNLGCSYNNTYCPSTFECNLTLYNKNGILINNKQMSNTLAPQYNYTIPASNLSDTGLYYGRQVCCGNVGCADYSFKFTVNAQGKEVTTADSSLYIILLAILILVLGFSLFGSLKIQAGNVRTNDGQLLKINWLKYLKWFMFAISYVSLLGIFYFGWNLSYGVLEFSELASFFYMLYRIMFIAIFPMLIFGSVFILIMFLQDKRWSEMLTRGLTVKYD